MNKKVIFFDVDGTMIDRNVGITTPTAKTREIIDRMNKLGHYPVISTGRPMCMIRDDLKSLGFKHFLTSAGNYVVVDNQVVYRNVMDTKMVEKAMEVALDMGLCLYFENEKACYVHPEIRPHMNDFIERIGSDIFIDTEDFSSIEFYKGNMLWNDEEKFKQFVSKFESDFSFAVFAGNRGSTDVIPIGTSKAVGASKVVEALNLTLDDTYAIGDSDNDYEIIEFVGHGIAMGNSVDKVKAVADFITEDVANEGIYHAFNNMVWLKK